MSEFKAYTEGLTPRILIAMVLGAAVGLFFFLVDTGAVGQFFVDGLFKTVGKMFVNSLKMLVVPLVFVSLVCGVANLGGSSRLGFIAGKTLIFYLATTAIALTLALSIANVIDPGVVNLDESTKTAASASFTAKEAPGVWATFANIIPGNPIAAMANGAMLQIIVFALLFGFALSKMKEGSPRVLEFFKQLDGVILFMVMFLMRLAPYGVFCLIATMFADSGFDKILALFKYFGCVLFVLLLHGFVTYGLLLWGFTGLSPMVFFTKMGRLWTFAFSTASSNATIPVTLETVEEKMGVKNEVAAFTVPLGATINMDGTAIMQGVATVFIAQLYGVDIGMTGYLLVVLTATLASIGTAGVPGVGLIMLTMVLQQVNLPVEGIAIILGVDRLLDMVRTAVNITGDSVCSIVVAKTEGLLNEETYRTP